MKLQQFSLSLPAGLQILSVLVSNPTVYRLEGQDSAQRSYMHLAWGMAAVSTGEEPMRGSRARFAQSGFGGGPSPKSIYESQSLVLFRTT